MCVFKISDVQIKFILVIRKKNTKILAKYLNTSFLLNYPTKMCMKYAPYLHLKSAHWALNMLLFSKKLIICTYMYILLKIDGNKVSDII